MTEQLPEEMLQPIHALEALIRATPETERAQLQGDLHRLCERLEREGYVIPARLRELDELLTDSQVESRFDNLPV
jgi:hypothetical protein